MRITGAVVFNDPYAEADDQLEAFIRTNMQRRQQREGSISSSLPSTIPVSAPVREDSTKIGSGSIRK